MLGDYQIFFNKINYQVNALLTYLLLLEAQHHWTDFICIHISEKYFSIIVYTHRAIDDNWKIFKP